MSDVTCNWPGTRIRPAVKLDMENFAAVGVLWADQLKAVLGRVFRRHVMDGPQNGTTPENETTPALCNAKCVIAESE
jgi:hypothetical protein